MSFLDFQSQVNEARDTSEQRRASLKTARQWLASLTRKKNQLLREISHDARESDDRLLEIDRSVNELKQSISRGAAAYDAALKDELTKLNQFSNFTHPIENITTLNDAYPILL